MVDLVFKGEEGKPVATLVGANCINIILGRNGSGKSRFLRLVDSYIANDNNYRAVYVTPERTGSFQRDGNIETNMASPGWTVNVRRANQVQNGFSFKAMSHLALRNAENAYLRRLQNTDARGRSFQTDCLDPIGKMLANVSIEQGTPDFLFRTFDGTLVNPTELSSGESETIAVASEVLSFFLSVDPSKINVLLLDEPDVHLHPDLQARFGQYLLDRLAALDESARKKVVVCIATHSTALVCVLANSEFAVVGTKEFDSQTVQLSTVSEDIKKVAPFFGHPLSLSLSNDPMLILEGEDDERVWQQAARSAQGKIRVFPVLAHSVDQQSDLEVFCDKMLRSIYDQPKAYSLRDGDGTPGPLSAVGCVTRFRLQCYAIENLLLSDECLGKLGTDWIRFQALAEEWMANNAGHKDLPLLRELVSSNDRLKNVKIKNLRLLIVAIAKSTKPWEVVVGQTLAGVKGLQPTSTTGFSIFDFLGDGMRETFLS
ncbi:AAA family ATPase [Paraburkholderia sp. J94]|uniref:AAA family ATPase n=1 Tax=Paraburkholderia sp. J94 TaxID=2805441 RepID=UPI002AB30ABD|nr:AAA family ATPase [Paraburkholderia sp. J94]